jgi:hypothetical protein
MTWITKDNTIIASLEDMPKDVFGFVYEITNIDNGKRYIGKKQVVSVTKKKFGKRRLAEMTDKRAKKYEIVTKEAKWYDYVGSSESLLEDVKNGDRINKVILEFAFSKYHLTYLEAKYQFIEGAIESEDWYNDSILGKFFRSIFDFKTKTND